MLSRNMRLRLAKLATVTKGSVEVIPDFAVFVDLKADYPAVFTFDSALRRGMCHPVLVDYDPTRDELVWWPDTKRHFSIPRHPRHLFLTPDQWQDFLISWVGAYGSVPVNSAGQMGTARLRDFRKRVNLLRTFRQVAMARYFKETGRRY